MFASGHLCLRSVFAECHACLPLFQDLCLPLCLRARFSYTVFACLRRPKVGTRTSTAQALCSARQLKRSSPYQSIPTNMFPPKTPCVGTLGRQAHCVCVFAFARLRLRILCLPVFTGICVCRAGKHKMFCQIRCVYGRKKKNTVCAICV